MLLKPASLELWNGQIEVQNDAISDERLQAQPDVRAQARQRALPLAPQAEQDADWPRRWL